MFIDFVANEVVKVINKIETAKKIFLIWRQNVSSGQL
jgi:hypothetical protein